MTTSYITTHTADALARLPTQSQQRTNIEALLTTLVDPCAELETALSDLLVKRGIDSGEGEQLDAIGRLLNESRAGNSDSDYKRFLRAKVALDKSRGSFDELLNIATLVLGDPAVTLTAQNSGPATVVLKLGGAAVSDVTAAILSTYFTSRAVAAGVRIIVEYSDVAPAATFFWDTGVWDGGAVWETALDR